MNHSALESDLRELLDGQAQAVDVADPPTLESPGQAAPRRSGRVLMVAAAMILVVGGLAAIVGLRDSGPAPSGVPATSAGPVRPAGIAQPNVFPALPTSDPESSGASGTYGMWQFPSGSAALIGRVDGDTMTEGISIRVSTDVASLGLSDEPGEPVTIEGTAYEVYREQGTPVITTVVLPGSPAISFTGIDPVAFVRSAASTAVENATIDANGVATFSIGQLPDGYEIIVDAQQQEVASIAPQINLARPAEGEGAFVEVSVNNPLIGMATVGTWRRVDINGRTGWIDSDPAYVVVWPATDGSWAMAAAPSTTADAIGVAEAVEFIGEAVWRDRYQVDPPRFDGYTDPLDSRLPDVPNGADDDLDNLTFSVPEIVPNGYSDEAARFKLDPDGFTEVRYRNTTGQRLLIETNNLVSEPRWGSELIDAGTIVINDIEWQQLKPKGDNGIGVFIAVINGRRINITHELSDRELYDVAGSLAATTSDQLQLPPIPAVSSSSSVEVGSFVQSGQRRTMLIDTDNSNYALAITGIWRTDGEEPAFESDAIQSGDLVRLDDGSVVSAAGSLVERTRAGEDGAERLLYGILTNEVERLDYVTPDGTAVRADLLDRNPNSKFEVDFFIFITPAIAETATAGELRAYDQSGTLLQTIDLTGI